MSGHSKEPWRFVKSWVVTESGTGASDIAGHDDPSYGGDLIAESVCDDDGRRIVACVNACTGIATDEMEMIARAGRALTAHGEPRPTRAEEVGMTRFLFGHWTKTVPTVPGLYLLAHAGLRMAVDLPAAEFPLPADAADVDWWWSVALDFGCLNSPPPAAEPCEDGSAGVRRTRLEPL